VKKKKGATVTPKKAVFGREREKPLPERKKKETTQFLVTQGGKKKEERANHAELFGKEKKPRSHLSKKK